MTSTLVGIFNDKLAADLAQSRLNAAGIEASATAAESSIDPDNRSGVSRFIHNLFGSDTSDTADSHKYQEAFRRGHYGLTVHARSEAEADSAEQILNAAGALDIDESSKAWSAEGWTGAPPTEKDTGPGKLALMQEDLKVGKREVSKGAVRVYSRIVETPVEQTVTLRHERATIERTAVDRPATEADFAAFKEGTMDVREMAEEAVVSKTARVVGEVKVGRETTERTETIHDSVRKTQVDAERLGGTQTGSRSDP